MNLHLVRIATFLIVLVSPQLAKCEPTVTFLYPAGGRAGTSVAVKVNGELPTWPVRVWVDRPGLTVTTAGKDDDERRLIVQIAAEAEPGLYWLRVYDDSGCSTPKPFVVGRLPEALEQEPNDAPDRAQPLQGTVDDTQSVIVNGRLEKRGDVDVYAMDVSQGQTLVADIDAHIPLGTAVDTVLQILSPDGFVVAQNDDHQSLDSRLAYTVPHDGTWLVRVFGFPATPTSQIQFAGSAAYVYRLTVSTGPYVDRALPLAAHDEQPTEFRLFGWNLTTHDLRLMPEPNANQVMLNTEGIARSIHVPVVKDHLLVETEPCSEAEPMEVELPATITGQILPAGDRDAFAFHLNGQQTVVATLESRTLGYPLDGVLELVDANGKQLARNDDSAGTRDAALNHRAGTEGPLRLIVSDLHRRGGEEFVYRLRLCRAVPDYSLSISDHQIKLKAAEKSELTVNIERTYGHDKPISISAEGLPPGVSVTAVESTANADSAKQVKLSFEVEETAAAVSVPVKICGDDGILQKPATVSGGPLVDLWVTVVARKEGAN